MTDQDTEHRTAHSDIHVLILHVEWKLAELPRLAKEFGLGEAQQEFLHNYLSEELNNLRGLPVDVPEPEVDSAFETHFERSREFKSRVLGTNKEQE